MIIRIGIPASFRRLTAAARDLNAPVLVSANAEAIGRAMMNNFCPPQNTQQRIHE